MRPKMTDVSAAVESRALYVYVHVVMAHVLK